MTARKYLPLEPSEVERILKDLGFELKRTRGDHNQWEGVTHGTRRVCTVQQIRGSFSIGRMKTMIEQIGLTPDEFYKANSNIAKRYYGH